MPSVTQTAALRGLRPVAKALGAGVGEMYSRGIGCRTAVESSRTIRYSCGASISLTGRARIARGSVITVKQNDYVQAARALGASNSRMLLRHIAPNAVAPVIVVATIALGTYIALEATLSYLGVGLKPPSVSWGIDISSASPYIRNAPHALLWPSGALALTVLAFIMLGDAVRDALDPKLR